MSLNLPKTSIKVDNLIVSAMDSNISALLGILFKKIDNFVGDKFINRIQESEIGLKVIQDSQLTNNKSLQEIRARILKQEYYNPNTISPRAWEEIKKLSAEEFQKFEESICPLCDEIGRFLSNDKQLQAFLLDINAFSNLQRHCGDESLNKNKTTDAKLELKNKYCIIFAPNKLPNSFPILNSWTRDLLKICEYRDLNDTHIAHIKNYLKSINLSENNYKISK